MYYNYVMDILFLFQVEREMSEILREIKKNKTGAINDPLGQTHSIASSEHGFHCFVLLDFEKWDGFVSLDFEKWDGRTTCAETMIPTGRDCGLAEWINKAQFVTRTAKQTKIVNISE